MGNGLWLRGNNIVDGAVMFKDVKAGALELVIDRPCIYEPTVESDRQHIHRYHRLLPQRVNGTEGFLVRAGRFVLLFNVDKGAQRPTAYV